MSCIREKRELCTPNRPKTVTEFAFGSALDVVWRRFLLMSLALLSACASSGQRIDRAAEAVGFSRQVVSGADYRHVIYMNAMAAAGGIERMLVFLEGDGRPWSADGREPSADPTTRNPIALQLLAQSKAPGIYISRPCYQEVVDPKCSSDTWTGGRYSREVVESFAAAIKKVAHETGAREIALIGHSGGGALAVLIAERSDNVAAVVTIAANLDVHAWTRLHRYLPLSTSLDPAASDIPHPWRELHLAGEQDTVVPVETTAAYFKKYPQAQQRVFAKYGHACCWVREWARIEEVMLEVSAP
jgi:predicted alpha/beta hydrolase family esterase